MHARHGRSLCFLLALLVTTSALSQISISEPRITRAGGSQSNAASATDGRDFLLVWNDSRSGRDAVYATRVAADGSILDAEGILLSNTNERTYSAAVAWTGDAYVIAWSGENGCSFRRLGADGRLIDASSRVFESGACYRPRVAAANGAAMIAAVRPYAGVDFVVVESNGVSRRLPSMRAPGLSAFACSSRECVVAWTRWNDEVAARRIAWDGVPLDAADVTLALDAADPALAANDDRFLLAWTEKAASALGSSRLWARELTGEPFVVTETNAPSIHSASVAPSGCGFIVAWNQQAAPPLLGDRRAPSLHNDRIELHAKRIGDEPGEAWTIAAAVQDEHPAISSNGTNHLGAWIEPRTYKIRANVPGVVTTSATTQMQPQLVDCGDHVLVVWAEELRGNGNFTVLARRFRLSGDAIDATPIAIASSVYSQTHPAAAFDGQSYLIAWSENDGTRARSLDRNGRLAPEVTTLSMRGGGRASVVATDRGFAILHPDNRDTLAVTQLPAGTRTTLVDDTGEHAIGWNGSELVALWAHQRLLARRITPDGIVLDREPILVGFGNNGASSPSVACDRSQCAVRGTSSERACGARSSLAAAPTASVSRFATSATIARRTRTATTRW